MDILSKVCPKNTEGFYKEFTRLIEGVNEVSIWFMGQKNFEKAADVLERCFNLVKDQPYIFVECFLMVRNNQAALWRYVGNLNRALIYLQKAENILVRNQDLYSGITYLNLASLYSQMKEYNSVTKAERMLRDVQWQPSITANERQCKCFRT